MAENLTSIDKLAILALLSTCKSDDYCNDMLSMIDKGHENVSTAEVLTTGLKHESMHGFFFGIMAAIHVVDGGDPIEEFDLFIEALEKASEKTLVLDFQRQVDRYSETGED